MPTQMLYEKTVKNAKAPDGARAMIWDSAIAEDRSLSGSFGIRVTAGGVKSWIIMFRIDGKQQYRKIGSYPALSLATARDSAREALKSVGRGVDPIQAKAEEKRRVAKIRPVASAVDEFIEKYAKRNNRSWKEVERVLRVYVVSKLGDRPLPSITAADIHGLLDGLVDAGHPYMANRLLAHTRKFFNWCASRNWISDTPTKNIVRPANEEARDRILSGTEIGLLWRACGDLGWPFGPCFKFLLLTGQRRNEAATMEWANLDLDGALWTLPRQATKTGRAHEVPLAPVAVQLLQSLPRNGPYVFSTNGRSPISGFSKAKLRCDKLISQSSSIVDDEGVGAGETHAIGEIPGWRLHDLRRTVASGMAEIGIAPHVIEKVLNHMTGQISGVAAVYNRHQYLREKTDALAAWSRSLLAIVEPDEGNIVELRGSK
jgi:integrase